MTQQTHGGKGVLMKAYYNEFDPQVASQFIKAFMEI